MFAFGKVEILLENGAPVDSLSPGGNTPLFYAARTGRSKICKLLIEKGALKNVRNANGESPLLFASSGASQTPNPGSDPSDFPATILFLISLGLSVRDVNLNGLNSLHCVSTIPSILSLFIDHYSSSDALKAELAEALAQKSALGETALHLAALDGNFKTTQLLLNLSADPLVTNKAGKTPKQCTKDPAVLSLLKHAESTHSQQYYAKQDALLQELASNPSTSTNKSKPTSASKKNKKVQAKESSAVVQKAAETASPVPKASTPSNAAPKAVAPASSKPQVVAAPQQVSSASRAVESKATKVETSASLAASQSASTEESSWASMVTKKPSTQSSEKVSFKMERTEETTKTAEEVAAASDGLQSTSEETNKKEAMAKAQSMLNGSESSEGRQGREQGNSSSSKSSSSPSSASLQLAGPPGIVNREDEHLQERVNSLHVSAEALELKVEHLLGLSFSDLSMEQLNALADIHRNALACIEEAKLDVVRRQERAFFEEELERRIDTLKRLHLRDSN